MATTDDANELAKIIASYTISPSKTQCTQIQHRLSLLAAWLGSVSQARHELQGKTVLELGCGQGDMTATLAHFVGLSDSTLEQRPVVSVGRVLALDPAPLDYGAPFTLGQAQGHLSSNAQVGQAIRWIQAQPMEYIEQLAKDQARVDYVVMAHCLFYFESAQYFSQLMEKVRSLAVYSVGMKVLVAEWAYQVPASKKAMPHYLAVKVQKLRPLPSGNVQTVLTPEELRNAAVVAGWRVAREEVVYSPKVEDGQWEVYAAREVRKERMVDEEIESLLGKLERSVEDIGGCKEVEALDVWTGVFGLGEG